MAAQRFGSPATDFGETRWHEITFSAEWPPHPRVEGGQVEPVLARLYDFSVRVIVNAVCLIS